MSFYILVLTRIEIKESIDFGNGLRINPITNEISVFDLAALGANGFREWALLEPYINATKCELISDFNGKTEGGFDLLNRAWLLSTMFSHLGYYIQCIAASDKSWNDFAGIHRNNLKSGELKIKINILDYHREIIKNPADAKLLFTSEDISWIKDKYAIYNKLAFQHSNFMIALESSTNWRYSNSARLAIASIWAGIESLFSINSELVFRISLYIANILESERNQRIIKYKQIRELYGLRSKAIHGDKMSDEKLLETIHNSYGILRDLILKIANNGNVFNEDLINEAIFGKEPQQ